jgi:molybdate transport system ATP-binding protein
LGSLLRQKPYQLSGGEKQRVALGRALMSKPRLLMLDEPLASLDKRLKSQILPYLKRVAEEVEIPMIYVSHSMDEITQLTDHVMHIAHGKVHAAI